MDRGDRDDGGLAIVARCHGWAGTVINGYLTVDVLIASCIPTHSFTRH